MTDFSKTLIRCSSIGDIMTEPKAKADKEAGNLSETAKKALKRIYAQVKYGRRKEIITKYMEKGKLVEEESITLFSRVERRFYRKNEESLCNEYLSGTYDLDNDEGDGIITEIVDIKSSWDLDTFMDNVDKPLDNGYFGQLQGYMALTGASKGTIAYCLVNTPEIFFNEAKYRLFKSMDVISEHSPEYLVAVATLENTMKFDDIPPNERVYKISADRDDEYIKQVYKKVEKCREYLAYLEEKHTKNGCLV
jgi:hypothetical protein